MLARAGFENVEKDNAYNGMTLREWARMSLTERGIGVASYNPMQMVGLALTHSTSDFGNILLDVSNKGLIQGWEESEETFQKWTRKGRLSDFKTAYRVGMGGFGSLRQVREGRSINTSPPQIARRPLLWPPTGDFLHHPPGHYQ